MLEDLCVCACWIDIRHKVYLEASCEADRPWQELNLSNAESLRSQGDSASTVSVHGKTFARGTHTSKPAVKLAGCGLWTCRAMSLAGSSCLCCTLDDLKAPAQHSKWVTSKMYVNTQAIC